VGIAWLDDGTILFERRKPGEDAFGSQIVSISENGGDPLMIVEPADSTGPLHPSGSTGCPVRAVHW
jgi:hypothetical protein